MGKEREFDLGTPGASARRALERRRAAREARVREQHPRLGGLILKFAEQPQHERSWGVGALGEEELAKALAERCPALPVLHDRRIPESRTNIDHIAIAPSGVYVIDAKRLSGKVEVRAGDAGTELFVGGRRRRKLLEGLGRQVEVVRDMLRLIERDPPVHGCFCFLGEAAVGLRKSSLSVAGFELLQTRSLTKRLCRPGDLDTDEIEVLAEALAALLPVA